MRFGLLAVVLGAALLLGGGSRSGFVGDVAVQLLAVPLLVFGARDWIVKMAKDELWRTDHLFLNLALAASVLIIFLQFALWPGDVGELADNSSEHLLSLQSEASLLAPWSGTIAMPALSWAAVASSIPFFAVFFGVSGLDQEDRVRLAMLVVAISGFSLLIGFLQVSQGSESGLRFYAITNPSEAVGFFANRNHFAALLYATLILTAVLLLAGEASQPVALGAVRPFWLILTAVLLIAILSGIALARSRAGVALGLVAIAGIFALHWRPARGAGGRGMHRPGASRRLLFTVAACGVLFAIQFGMQRVMSRFETDSFNDLRASLSPATAALALQHMPFGTGLGFFEQTYAISEADADISSGYVNRAHNDWAEFFLETGLPGAIVCGLFFIWLTGRTLAAWKTPLRDNDTYRLVLERGGSLIVFLLLAHSVVDYPLRTTALSSLFAFAAALLIAPPVFDNNLPPWRGHVSGK